MSKFIKVTEKNLEEISKCVEVLEVLDSGVRFYGTRNGIVITEMLAKWGDSIAFSGDVIEVVHESFEKALADAFPKTVEGEFVNIEVNLPEGIEKTLELTSDAELTEIVDVAMKEAVATIEKTKKVKNKKAKKAE